MYDGRRFVMGDGDGRRALDVPDAQDSLADARMR
jgi:hypothetical protein